MSQPADQGLPNSHARMGKAVHWRRDPVILARLPDVERRHLAGQTNLAIAAALSIDETTVRRDLQRLRELWLERVREEIANLKARAFAELEHVRLRALQAFDWDLACERAVLFGIDEQGQTVEVRRDDKGSARFSGQKAQALQVARQATMDQAKLLGLIVDKVAPTDSQGNDLSLDELMERYALAQERAEKGSRA